MKYTIPTKQAEFFKWYEYRDNNLIVPGGISIIVGGRDIGKTTGTFIEWIKNATPSEQIFYIRNTEKELKQYAKTFNAQFSTQFYMTTTEIYTLERVDLYKKIKDPNSGVVSEIFDKTEYRKKDVIGFCGALGGADGWRSANFENIKYIFSDEFNQIGNSLDFQKFMTLWTSILRTKQDVYTVLIGNRDDASSDIIVELGIDIVVPDNYSGDYVVQLLPDSDVFRDKCYFIDVDDRRFNNNNKPTIWKELGRASISLNEYYNRGYKSYDNIDCRRLKNETMKRINWLFSYDETEKQTLIVGKLETENEQIIVVHHLRPEEEYEAPLKYSDALNTYTKDKYNNLSDNYEYFFYTLTNAERAHNIVFTSIAAKEMIHLILKKIALIMDMKKLF